MHLETSQHKLLQVRDSQRHTPWTKQTQKTQLQGQEIQRNQGKVIPNLRQITPKRLDIATSKFSHFYNRHSSACMHRLACCSCKIFQSLPVHNCIWDGMIYRLRLYYYYVLMCICIQKNAKVLCKSTCRNSVQIVIMPCAVQNRTIPVVQLIHLQKLFKKKL